MIIAVGQTACGASGDTTVGATASALAIGEVSGDPLAGMPISVGRVIVPDLLVTDNDGDGVHVPLDCTDQRVEAPGTDYND